MQKIAIFEQVHPSSGTIVYPHTPRDFTNGASLARRLTRALTEL